MTASLTGTVQGGVNVGTTTINTSYEGYCVKSQANSTDFVFVVSTTVPIVSNISKLNTAFGTNGWIALGLWRVGDNQTGGEQRTSGSFLTGYQSGACTYFSNGRSWTTLSPVPGYEIMFSSGAAIQAVWNYSPGMSGFTVPQNVTFASVHIAAQDIQEFQLISADGNQTPYMLVPSTGNSNTQITVDHVAIKKGLKMTKVYAAGNYGSDTTIQGFCDDAISQGMTMLWSSTTVNNTTGGGGGYAVEPATVTFNLAKGVTASTGTFSSVTTYPLTVNNADVAGPLEGGMLFKVSGSQYGSIRVWNYTSATSEAPMVFATLGGDAMYLNSAGQLSLGSQSIDNKLNVFGSGMFASSRHTAPANGLYVEGATILGSTLTVTSSSTFNGNVGISSGVLLSGSAGVNGQVLTSGGAGAVPTWTTASSGGASTLAVATGTSTGFTGTVSSPTAVVNFNSSQFAGALTGSATAYMSLLASSVTLQGNTVSLAALSSSMTAVGVATGTISGNVTNLTSSMTAVGISTGTLFTLANGKVNYASFTVSVPLQYNNTTGAFGVDKISLSTGVIGTLPAGNMVSTAAFITSTQTISGQRTHSSTIIISTTIGLGGLGTVGTAGQFLTSGGPVANPTWTTITSAGLASTQTWTGQETWASPSPSTFTYGVYAGSITTPNITVSSNAIFSGATFYANAATVISTMTVSSATASNLSVTGTLTGRLISATQNDITSGAVMGAFSLSNSVVGSTVVGTNGTVNGGAGTTFTAVGANGYVYGGVTGNSSGVKGENIASGPVGYGGWFSASGATQNYGVFIDSGQFQVNRGSATFNGIIQSTAIYVSSATIGMDEYANGAYVAISTITWLNGNMQKVTLTANTAFNFIAPAHPGTLTLRILTGAGSFACTWPAAVHWSGGTAPTITVTASKVDFVVCKYASDGVYYCSASGTQNFTP